MGGGTPPFILAQKGGRDSLADFRNTALVHFYNSLEIPGTGVGTLPPVTAGEIKAPGFRDLPPG